MHAAEQMEEAGQIRKMRWASRIEGTTLILLLAIAVPLKHIAGLPSATAVMGPIHGIAFVLYIWTLVQTVSSVRFTKSETIRMSLAAFVPLGGFFNERALARRQASLTTAL